MSNRVKRLTLLLFACSVISISLVACQASGSPNVSSGDSGGNNIAGFKTPNAALWTPTPTFPPFTMGVWPSNYSPALNDTITIYVQCRLQHADMAGPADPAANMAVHVSIPALGKTLDGTTDAVGTAAIQLTYSAPVSGTPIRVYVTAQYKGTSYNAETVFTPDISKPPTPTAPPNPTATP